MENRQIEINIAEMATAVGKLLSTGMAQVVLI
jgi:hypothetical protein